MLNAFSDLPRAPVEEIFRRLRPERAFFDLDDPRDLELLRADVERIARAMDDGAAPLPPMFWSGVPWPTGDASGSSEACLVISVGGTNTDFRIIRLAEGEVLGFDAAGDEVSGDALERATGECHMKTPTPEDVPGGLEMVEAMARGIARYLRAQGDRLEQCRHTVVSWGFPHRVVRTRESLLGGLTAISTSMTKHQAPFSDDLAGHDVGRLFEEGFERAIGWRRPVTVANDTVMALHYFLGRERRERHPRIGLLINGTGTNFSMVEPYAVREAGVVSRGGEQYEPRRLRRGEPAGPGERVEPYFVNYEAGSIELGARRTDFGRGDAATDRPDLLGMEGSVWRSPGYPERVRAIWERLAGGGPLRVELDAEKAFSASAAGPLYLSVLHRAES